MRATLNLHPRCYAGENARTSPQPVQDKKNMSFRAPLQCMLPLTSLLLGFGTSSALAVEANTPRPLTLSQAQDQTPPSPSKEKPDEPAKKHPQQDKAKPDAQKQQPQDKAKG